MLSVANLSLKFADRLILDDFGFHLQAGEIACLLGASGCGKTSALRSIAGFVLPFSGQITLNDKIIFNKTTNIPAHKRHIGMVFQDYALFGHLTVAQNIGFGLHAQPKSDQQKRIDQMLEFVGLHTHKNHYPHELSGGQQQRIALARALAPKPPLILLDEPFSSLDSDTRAQLAKEMRELLLAQKVSAIMVTHDQQEAFAIADKVGVIHNGRMVQWATPQTLYQSPSSCFVADFIGQGVVLPDGLLHHNMPIVIRPEHVMMGTGDLSATIIQKDYKGDHYLYTLQLNHPSTPNIQPILSKSSQSYVINQSIAISITHVTPIKN